MSERAGTLRARFRDDARERVLELREDVERLRRAPGAPERAQAVTRTLHTLKGDAALMGLGGLSHLFHVVEDVFIAHLQPEGRLDSTIAAAIRGSFDVALRGFGQGDLDEPAATAAFSEAARALAPLAAPGAVSPRGPASVAPQPVAEEAPERPAVARFIRQDRRALDLVSDRVLELWVAYGQLAARVDALAGEAPGAAAAAARDEADSVLQRVEELVDAAWALRLGSLEDVLRALGQHAVDLAGRQGKLLCARVEAAGTALERATLDALRELLLHLVRNAVDHGVEPPALRGDKAATATLRLSAEPSGMMLLISVEDDGRGVDGVAVRTAALERRLLEPGAALSEADTHELLFRPGFSTRSTASELSGRGMGLDVVRRGVEAIGGSVVITSEPGRFTRFTLSVPAAVARERFLVIDCPGGVFALPARGVREVLVAAAVEPRASGDGQALEHRGEWLPLRDLDAVLGVAAGASREHVLILEHGGHRFAFAAAGTLRERDLLRRPADALVGASGLVSATSVLEDGRSVLILSVPSLVRAGAARRAAAPAARRHRRALVVDDSLLVRDLVCSILGSIAIETTQADDGEKALAALEANDVDIVITDVEMPRMDGFELLGRVRQRWPLLPVVVLTTRGSPEDRRRAATLGANDYLAKSDFEVSRLVDVVRRILGDEA